MAVSEQLPEIVIFRIKEDLIVMVGQIPQNDPSFHATLVSECLSRRYGDPHSAFSSAWENSRYPSF